MKINFSNFLSLNLADLAKGFIMAVITTALGMILVILESGGFPNTQEWTSIGKAALIAGVGYLLKNLFTPPPATVIIDPTKTDVEHKRS